MIAAPFRILLAVLVTAVVSLVVLLYIPFLRTGKTYHRLGRFWARQILRIFRISVTMHGSQYVKKGEHYIYASNHASMFDIPTVLASIPDDVHIVLKKELTRVPLWGWVLKLGPYIVIDRFNPRDAFESLNEAAEKIRSGKSVLLFVEGTRTRDGKLQPFKRGTFALAVKSGIPIIPVAINNTFRILPKGSINVRPAAISLVLDTPIPTSGYEGKEGEQKLMSLVEASIVRNYVEPN